MQTAAGKSGIDGKPEVPDIDKQVLYYHQNFPGLNGADSEIKINK